MAAWPVGVTRPNAPNGSSMKRAAAPRAVPAPDKSSANSIGTAATRGLRLKGGSGGKAFLFPPALATCARLEPLQPSILQSRSGNVMRRTILNGGIVEIRRTVLSATPSRRIPRAVTANSLARHLSVSKRLLSSHGAAVRAPQRGNSMASQEGKTMSSQGGKIMKPSEPLALARQHFAVGTSIIALLANLGTPAPVAAQDHIPTPQARFST